MSSTSRARSGRRLGPATDRVLDVAESHFAARGYAAVTLKDIADDLGIKQASLYYHVPGGKEDLYVEVMLRSLERHGAALGAVSAPDELPADDLEERLVRMARWVAGQPSMNLGRMMDSDMPELGPRHRRLVEEAVVRCLMRPVEQAFEAAALRGRRLRHAPRVCAGAFWAIVPTLRSVQRVSGQKEEPLVAMFVDLVLHGAVDRVANK